MPYRRFRRFLERIVMKRRMADAPEEFDKASPIARISADAPPFMVLQGTRDSLTPAAGAARFVEALRAKAGAAPVVFVELPGAHHAFEIFPSLRSVPAVHGVHRFCQALYAAIPGRPRRPPRRLTTPAAGGRAMSPGCGAGPCGSARRVYRNSRTVMRN